jgi:beta-N-acetylhexosaminidase
MAKASLPDRVAQLMLVTIEGGVRLTGDDTGIFKSAIPGGVLVRRSTKPTFAAGCVTELRALELKSGVPLLVGADLYELASPGPGTASGFAELPSLLTLAAANDPETTQRLGQVLGTLMAAMGFNLYLGPSLALAPTVQNARGTVNCLGGNPAFVAEAGTTICRELQKQGVAPMPMGFPGGGLNRSERGAAVLTTPRDALRDGDLLPFAAAIKDGARILQVGNTLVPTLAPGGPPAGLSDAVLRDLLRKEMGFDGIIVSGPMDSEDVTGLMDGATAAAAALERGADMILWRSAATQPIRAIEFICGAVARGDLSEAAINVTVRRVLNIKAELAKLAAAAAKDRDPHAIDKLDGLLKMVQSVNRHAVTLAHHRPGTLPLVKKISTPVGITGTAGVEELTAALEKPLKQVVEQPIMTAHHIGDIQRFEIKRLTDNLGGINTVVCVLTDQEKIEGQVELVRELKKKVPHVVIVYLGYPAHAAFLGDADAILLGYSTSASVAETMSVMAEALLGTGALGFVDLPETLRLKVNETRTFGIADTVQTPPGRLPLDLNENSKAGTAARYDPTTAVKKAEWDFAGKRVGKPSVPWTFEAPGEYPVSLTVTDDRGESRTHSFKVVVSP